MIGTTVDLKLLRDKILLSLQATGGALEGTMLLIRIACDALTAAVSELDADLDRATSSGFAPDYIAGLRLKRVEVAADLRAVERLQTTVTVLQHGLINPECVIGVGIAPHRGEEKN